MIAGDLLPEQDSKRTRETTAYEETSMFSAGEHVAMQTVLVDVMPTDHLASELTRVLTDTRSSRTYVTKEIAQKLNLQPNELNNITIYSTSKPKEIMSPVVTLYIKSKDGNTIMVKANVVIKISGNIQKIPTQLKNQFSIQKRCKLADILPQRTESSTIGILI